MAGEFSLLDKAALVIGASNPIGRAIAVALAEAGADVAVATTTRAQSEEVIANSCCNEMWALNRKSFAQAMDASSEADVSALVDRAVAELGKLEVLVNAQDLPFAKPLAETSYEEWRRVLDTNAGGMFLSAKAAAPHLLGHGRIINVATVLGERGMANGSAYCTAQAGVFNLTRALALEFAREGINVNAIGAGWTEGMGIIGGEDNRQQLERYLPYKRLAKPDEIAGTAVYLASEAAAYLTGQVVWVEGGALSHV
ncbi:MAG TPA: SDR family oxidoreductase [Dehalococcoidia bacterium]|jgi:NAD(P)-dependent dehydrogenase (short-subunit alcohol dehydrogenase family)|nr:SDR family oxidoreductase [Dehalococcoidia bacterium]